MINELENILPSLKNDHQKTSLQNAIAIGVPSMKQEEWKYTYYNKILQQGFTVDTHSCAYLQQEIEKEFIDEYAVSENRIVFVNGVFHNELSQFKSHPKINLWNSNNISENSTKDFLLELNNALATDGLFLEIGDGVICEELIEIFYIQTNSSAIVNLHNKIKVGKNAQVKLAEYYINYDA